MNILHITTYLQGGAGKIIYDLLAYQKEVSHKVAVVASKTGYPGYCNYVGYIEADGEIWVNGNSVGSLEKDGEVWHNGNYVGAITDKGEVFKRGNQVGFITKKGEVLIGSSSRGTVEGPGDWRRAAIIYYFDFYN